jgi:quercetin dioxygenase-like cupin family protein
MSKSGKDVKNNKGITLDANDVLDNDILQALAHRVLPTSPSLEVERRIKQKLMQRVLEAMPKQSFVFANEGEWIKIADGVTLKLLHKTSQGKSFLIKMAENAKISTHEHVLDEESFVLEGEVTLDGVLCRKGDYHFAPAGSMHQEITTTSGCTLLIRGA